MKDDLSGDNQSYSEEDHLNIGQKGNQQIVADFTGGVA